MKKLLLASALSSVVASGAFAAENSFYLGVDAGVALLPKQTHPINNVKSKSSNHFNLGLSVGYNVTDSVRADLRYAHHFSADTKSQTAAAPINDEKHSFNVSSLMVNGYVDLFDYGVGKLFAGAGLGMSMVSDKVEYRPADGADNEDHKAKTKYNFAYRLTVGSTFALSDCVNLDVSYSFNDFGKTKSVKDGADEKSNLHLRTHEFLGGVRISL